MSGMQPEVTSDQARVIRALRHVALFLLVAVVAIRPLVSESYDSATNSISGALEGLTDPSPARTLLFDLVILVAACLWLVGFAKDRSQRYRRTGMEIGLALLTVAGVMSCWFAGNQRLAINGTVDWLCLPILAITLAQLVRSPWQRRFVLAAIVASACVNAAQCYEQYFVGFHETVEQYQANRESFWASQGVALDSTTVEAFERRLRASEASGFFAHSNVAGAYLMLCTFAAISLMVRLRGANALQPGLLAVEITVTLLLAGAIVLTGSLGAILAGAVGAVLLLLAWWKREWIASHNRQVFWISCVVVIAATAAVVGHGLYHDSLPGWSLTFRWQYWKASAEMIADHLWTGVGRENFGRHYLQYKDIASPEEVANPHNVFVQATAEWGIFGLLGVVTMIVGVSRRLLPRPSDLLPPKELDTATYRSERREIVAGLIVLCLWVVAGRALFLGSTDWNYIYYSVATTGLVWVPAFALFFWLRREECAHSTFKMSLVLATGLFAFLLQEQVNFALFVPASATTFFATLGICLSGRPSEQPAQHLARPGLRWTCAVVLVAITSATLFAILAPVSRSGHWLTTARNSPDVFDAGGDPNTARLKAFLFAMKSDNLDPTPWVEQARWLAGGPTEESWRMAVRSLDAAILRDRHNRTLYQRKADLYRAVAGHSHEKDDYLAAVSAAEAALALYPQDPQGLAWLAKTEFAAGRELASVEFMQAAMGHFKEALAMDQRRLAWETIRRLRPREVEEIHRKIEDIQRYLSERQQP